MADLTGTRTSIVTEVPGSRPDLPQVNLPPAPMPVVEQPDVDTGEGPLEIEIRPAAQVSDNPNDINKMMLRAYEDQSIIGDGQPVVQRGPDGSYSRISANAHAAQMTADTELSSLSPPEEAVEEEAPSSETGDAVELLGRALAASDDGGLASMLAAPLKAYYALKDSPVGEGIANFVGGTPAGIVEGFANVNDLIPIGTWQTPDGREITTLKDAMDYVGQLIIDAGVPEDLAKAPPAPPGLMGGLGKGIAQAGVGMFPLIKAMKAAGYGPLVADLVGSFGGDYITSSKKEANELIKAVKMIPSDLEFIGIPAGEGAHLMASDIEDFINAPAGSPIDEAFRKQVFPRLFAAVPGVVLTTLISKIGRLAIAAKNSGEGELFVQTLREFFEDTSGSVKLPGQAAVAEGNLWGLMSRFRQAATVQPEHTKPLITAATNTKNATRQAKGLDDVISRHPEPFSSEEAFSNMWADALGDTDVPIPPYRFIQMANEGRLHDEMLDLTPDQLRMADDGLEFANDFASLYRAGGNAQADATTTAKLTLWGMLSRGVSPSVQEAGFLDAINGIEPFIQAALGGKFDDKMLVRYLDWASGVIKEGSFGRGTQHNLNAFGKDFLRKMGAGEAGNSPLQQFHDLLSDLSVSSKDVRRRFYELADDPGINNKVLSFMMLLAGRKDVVIIDRIQAKAFFDDGRFDDLNLWDGEKVRTGTDKLATKAGTSLAEIFKGHRGLLLYEQIEAELARQLPKGVTAGEWHWKTWVKRGNQEADHASLLGLIKQARGDLDPYVGAKAREGRFGTWNYGFSQVKTKRGFRFEYPASDGTIYTFTKDTKEALISDIKKRGSGVIPKGFSVQKAGKEGRPWTEAEGVDLGKLDELIRKHGRKSGSTQSGDGTVPASGEGRAAAGPRGGRGRGRRKLGAPLNPPKGGS